MFKQPSNNRDWEKDQKILAHAMIESGKISLFNIRNFKYRSEFDYEVDYCSQVFEIDRLIDVSLGIVAFSKNPLLAHILTTFEFADGKSVVFSIEVRKQKDQKFIAWQTAFNNYELMYVVATRSDVIDLRNKHRKNERVVEYKLNLDQDQKCRLFLDFCIRLNQLKGGPEFFNLFYNSCSSNAINHLNKVLDWKVPWFYKYLAPGYLDKALGNRKIINQ